jgi:hypothetical protein
LELEKEIKGAIEPGKERGKKRFGAFVRDFVYPHVPQLSANPQLESPP